MWFFQDPVAARRQDLNVWRSSTVLLSSARYAARHACTFALTFCPWLSLLLLLDLLDLEELDTLVLVEETLDPVELTEDTLEPVELEEDVLEELLRPTANLRHDLRARRASSVLWPIATTLLWYVARHALTFTFSRWLLLEELVLLLEELETLCASAAELPASDKPMAAPVMRVRRGVFIRKEGRI